MAKQRMRAGKRYPLLPYRLKARRYRPFGVFIIVVGVLAMLPQIFPQFQQMVILFDFQTLTIIGAVVALLGLIVVIASILESRLAYAQCTPEYLLINTSGGRVACSYARVIQTKNTLLRDDLVSIKSARGSEKRYLKPLAGREVLEVVLDELPLPREVIQRRIGSACLSLRDVGFVLIVPNPTEMAVEINTYSTRMRDQMKGQVTTYQDPFERASAMR